MADVEEALKDLHLIKAMIMEARGRASNGASFLMLWGAIWLVGFLLPAVEIPSAIQGPIWLLLDAVGLILSVAFGARLHRQAGPAPYLLRLWGWSAVILAVYGVAAGVVVGHTADLSPNVPWIVCLTIGTWYVLGGMLLQVRSLLGLGAWMAVLAVSLSFVPFPPVVREAVMGVLGGGVMLGTGLWLHRRGSR